MMKGHTLIVLLLIIVTVCQSKHHRRFSCSVQERCPVHKHKICGTDGKLYPSRCHLRKAACDTNTIIRPAHPDQCLNNEEEEDTEEEDIDSPPVNSELIQQQPPPSPPEVPDSIAVPEVEHNQIDYSDEDECHPKDYDLMKEKVLNKINDVALLFTRLDENNDGQVSLNELWKHSTIYKDSSCLLTDLIQHEDSNGDEKLDYSEFQSAFNKLFSVTMVTLDESLAVNKIQAHLGDNVEIRCDITGEPQKPAIKWYRHGVDLSTLNLPFIKVFSDGSLYLTDLQLSFSGNYSCQAVNNPTVKQTHTVHVIVDPIVEVTPRFQWTPIGGVANFECRYETFEDDYRLEWFKNDEQLVNSARVTILNNSTRLQVAALEQTDTGAYTCRVIHQTGVYSQSVASLLVQDETVESASSETRPQRLWVFHANGLSVYEGICGQPIHEIDARDIIFQNSLTLCGNAFTSGESEATIQCDWSEDVIMLNDHVYIAQPSLNRIVVFQASQLIVTQVIATDPNPHKLWTVDSNKDPQIWVLCNGNTVEKDEDESSWRDSLWPDTSSDMSSATYNNEKFNKNHKTIQVVRLGSVDSERESPQSQSQHRSQHRQADVIHLQPVDGHFDLVYDLFMPIHYESIFKTEVSERLKSIMRDSPYAYVSHWEERSLIKVSLRQLEYMHSVRLADCQPIAASIITKRSGGLLAVQCQTPVTHQLNGQLIIDQVTDAILSHNTHLNAHASYLSPDHRYLVSIYHEYSNTTSTEDHYQAATLPSNTSTIIVQRVNDNGVEFLYDVRTSLDIVNCVFVWKNGNYDLVLASGTHNREDLLYLSLIDGHVELISGIGRPSEGNHRGLALSTRNRVLSVTATESVYTVDLNTNRILCESSKHFQRPRTLLWTN